MFKPLDLVIQRVGICPKEIVQKSKKTMFTHPNVNLSIKQLIRNYTLHQIHSRNSAWWISMFTVALLKIVKHMGCLGGSVSWATNFDLCSGHDPGSQDQALGQASNLLEAFLPLPLFLLANLKKINK